MKCTQECSEKYLEIICSHCNEKLKLHKDNIIVKERDKIILGGHVCPKCKNIIFISFCDLVKIY